MVGFTDRAGVPPAGGASYRPRLPPNIPAARFRPLTLDEAETTSGSANGQRLPSKGSAVLYRGRTAPSGKVRDRMRGIPAKRRLTILRLHSPAEAAIGRSRKPGDIEKIQ